MPATAAVPSAHQRHADSIRREMIVDAERRNPGCAAPPADRLPGANWMKPASATSNPATAASRATARAAAAVSLRQEHERQHAEE